MPAKKLTAWTAFLIPGLPQLGSGEALKGAIYFLLSIGTAALAFGVNRYFFLKNVWTFKSLEMPSTFIKEYYATKQSTLYNFIFIYLAIGLISAIDHARAKKRS